MGYVRNAFGAALIVAAILLIAAAPASAAPTDYVVMADGAQIAINVKVPVQCTAMTPCATFFEMSGYESGSDEGKTPAGHLADDFTPTAESTAPSARTRSAHS